MTRLSRAVWLAGWMVLLTTASRAAIAQTGLATLSNASKECVECHRSTDVGIIQQWGESRHYRAKVGCFECHQGSAGYP